jgi:Peptidase family M48
VTDRPALRRAELALALVGLTPVLLALVFLIDAGVYHGLAVQPQTAFAVISALVIGRAAASLARQLRAQRAFLRRLPAVRGATIFGYRVRVVAGQAPHAFCVGLVRPAVYVSEGALQVGDNALRAVLAHEAQHRTRRDPLRLLLARAVADALRPLPPFARLAERQVMLADLAADAAAVRALGGRAPIAAAMMRFEVSGGVAPARVDRLLGTARVMSIPAAVLAMSCLFLLAIAAALIAMLFADWHPDVTLPVPLEPAVLLALSAPACLAARRVTAGLRPAGA